LIKTVVHMLTNLYTVRTLFHVTTVPSHLLSAPMIYKILTCNEQRVCQT